MPETLQPEGTASEGRTLEAPLFRFDGIRVHRISFEELEKGSPAEGETRPRRMPYALEFNGGIVLDQDAAAAIVTLTAIVRPDPKWQPYRIEVRLSGRFSRETQATREQFEQFCKLSVPPILYPYIREIVYRTTRDGRYGTLLLDPINVQSLFQDWETVQSESPASPNGTSET